MILSTFQCHIHFTVLHITVYFLILSPTLSTEAVTQSECLVWGDEDAMRLENEDRHYLVPSGVALTIETTAYALLTALEHKDLETAHRAACFLSSQENYEGGFKSTQVRSFFMAKNYIELFTKVN